MRNLLLPPIVLVISAAAMVLLHCTGPLATLLAPPWNAVGVAFFLAGLAVAQWHARLFRRVGTEINTFRRPGRLVREGLFRVSRNPMYLGFAIALAGVALGLGSASPWLAWLLFILLTDRWYIRVEEAAMLACFGDEYAAYQREVRRWL
jgi:protein-S-isoprenylcysteine O-methyltransferase Ste14